MRWSSVVLVFVVIGACADESPADGAASIGRTHVDDLVVGSCFLEPLFSPHFVETVDCGDIHDYELYGIQPIDGFESWPGYDPLGVWVEERCVPLFENYVGLDPGSAEVHHGDDTSQEHSELEEEGFAGSDYWEFVIVPTPEKWEEGNRRGLCVAYEGDSNGDLLAKSGSIRGILENP